MNLGSYYADKAIPAWSLKNKRHFIRSGIFARNTLKEGFERETIMGTHFGLFDKIDQTISVFYLKLVNQQTKSMFREAT